MRSKAQKKEESKRVIAAQQALYTDMVKDKPLDSAVEAFRRRPYEIGGVHSELGRKSAS